MLSLRLLLDMLLALRYGATRANAFARLYFSY